MPIIQFYLFVQDICEGEEELKKFDNAHSNLNKRLKKIIMKIIHKSGRYIFFAGLDNIDYFQ